MTPYKHARAQALEPQHEIDRKNFAKWVLQQDEHFPQNIIFGDEKIFPLVMFPNRQNKRFWAVENPYIVDDLRHQGGAKYMVSVMIVDGQILKPYWFVDDEGVPFTQNGEKYRKMLQEHYVPILNTKFGRRKMRQLYFQQDGIMKYLFTYVT